MNDHVEQARRAIKEDDRVALARLVSEHPGLLTWRDGPEGEVLLQATTSYANFPGAEHEDHWNRRACAELLLDAGALVDPRVILRIMGTGAHRMMAMFAGRGLMPSNLRVHAALGRLDAVKACFDTDGGLLDTGRPDASLREGYPNAAADWPPPGDDRAVVGDAFLYACRLGHRSVARWLLDRCTALEPDLARRVTDPDAFVEELLEAAPEGARHALAKDYRDGEPGMVWQAAVTCQLMAALGAGDLEAARAVLEAEPFLLEADALALQEKMLSVAAYTADALPFVQAVFDLGAAIFTAGAPPASHAVSYAIEYGNAAYVPLLARIWGVPDDLPHAAGVGDLDAVKRWFDADGNVALGDPDQHDPFPAHHPDVTVAEVLGRALAWAVQNGEYPVADYLLERGADINTRWGTHEPASMLHENAFAGRREQVEYLLSKGIDTTILDVSYGSDAAGWALFAGHEDIAALISAHGS